MDLIIGGLENSVASIGGFCVGSSFIVEHQRLSGLGYCFSASSPPLLTQAAICALDRFENEPKMFAQLQESTTKLHNKLGSLTHMSLGGNKISPVKHLYIKESRDADTERALLKEIVGKVSIITDYCPNVLNNDNLSSYSVLKKDLQLLMHSI